MNIRVLNVKTNQWEVFPLGILLEEIIKTSLIQKGFSIVTYKDKYMDIHIPNIDKSIVLTVQLLNFPHLQKILEEIRKMLPDTFINLTVITAKKTPKVVHYSGAYEDIIYGDFQN